MVEGWLKAEEMARQLKAKGWKTTEEVALELGVEEQMVHELIGKSLLEGRLDDDSSGTEPEPSTIIGRDQEIHEFFGDAAASLIAELRVVWEVGKILKEKKRPVGYLALEALLKSKKRQGIIPRELPISERMLPMIIDRIENLFDKLQSQKPGRSFVEKIMQGKSRPVTAWTDRAWDAWKNIGRYLKAIGYITEDDARFDR